MTPDFPTARRRAFTLLEVLVALVIFALVLASLYATWRLVLQSNAAALRIAANAQRTRMCIQTIEEALGSAVFYGASASRYAFQADTSGDFAQLSFVANLSEAFPGSGRFDGARVRRIAFLVQPGENGGAELVMQQKSILLEPGGELVSRRDALSFDTAAHTFPVLLARDLSLFQLEFWDPQRNEYVPEWLRTNQLPACVRVSLGFGRAGRRNEPAQLVTRMVRLPSLGVAADAQVRGAPGGGQ
jgi:prepilin-type N-terminal cleavage/methylation domain-containing protein